jgi:hypothetical protein
MANSSSINSKKTYYNTRHRLHTFVTDWSATIDTSGSNYATSTDIDLINTGNLINREVMWGRLFMRFTGTWDSMDIELNGPRYSISDPTDSFVLGPYIIGATVTGPGVTASAIHNIAILGTATTSFATTSLHTESGNVDYDGTGLVGHPDWVPALDFQFVPTGGLGSENVNVRALLSLTLRDVGT